METKEAAVTGCARLTSECAQTVPCCCNGRYSMLLDLKLELSAFVLQTSRKYEMSKLSKDMVTTKNSGRECHNGIKEHNTIRGIHLYV